MILQISTEEFLLIKNALICPKYFEEYCTEDEKQALNNKLNEQFISQVSGKTSEGGKDEHN